MSETSASAVPASPAARAGAGPDLRRWLILGTVGLAQLMVVLDITIMNIALPSAQRALGLITGFWVAAVIFGADSVICGTLFRAGPLRASGPAAAARPGQPRSKPPPLTPRSGPISMEEAMNPSGDHHDPQLRQMTGDSAMAEHIPGDPGAGDRFVRLDDGDMHVVEDGKPGAPALLLIHGSGASTAWWDPVVPALAGACRVIRVDLLGHGRSSSPVGGYDIPAHARRVGAALDRLGAGRVTAIGHSMGCLVATALAEQRPDKVAALVLIDMGPSVDAHIPEGLLVRLLLARFPGRLLWRLRSEATIRKAMRTAFTRPIDIPEAIIEAALGMTHRALAGTARGSDDYLSQQSLPDRLAALGLPVLVIFGAEDARYPSSSAAAYRAVPGARVELLPGVGHTPMMEDPQTTGTLLLEFAAAAAHPH